MSGLSEIEFAVMDEIYFPATFQLIVKNTKGENTLIKSILKNLLEKKFVHQMKYNEQLNDYERCLDSDFENIEKYLYVASKNGLLAHNS